MTGNEFRFGEADLNSLTRLVFESKNRSRRVFKLCNNGDGPEIHYLERNGVKRISVGACSAQDFRTWCIQKKVRMRQATPDETRRDWKAFHECASTTR